MSAGESTVAMLGLTSAGKTTYAVVFYAACEAGLDGMTITRYGIGNREYLNQQADELAACRSLTRTSQQIRGELHLGMKLTPGGPERELVVPDLSGELLRDSMADRVFNPRLVELIEKSQALLLFVHSDHVLEPVPIRALNELLRAAGEEPGADVAPDMPEQWEISLATTQARLTDIVQELVRLRGNRSGRLALILSAWDTQDEECLSPGDWANRRLPLLMQLLENATTIDWEVFGVSAQGGDFDGPRRSELEALDVSERPKVQARLGDQVGIGAPLRWALEET